uniref:Uncharacterized protein n=1 Tax=Anguilla anguilla TaxID=7936 RepID=A0A0E9QQL2_ANGAN
MAASHARIRWTNLQNYIGYLLAVDCLLRPCRPGGLI